MIWAVLIGGGFGASVFGLWYAIATPRTNLATGLARWEAERRQAVLYQATPQVGWHERLGRWLVAKTADLGIDLDQTRADLALVDKSLEQHLVTKIGMALLGLLLPSVVVVLTTLAGTPIGLAIPGVVALVLAVVFFFVPDWTVRAEADKRRTSLTRALQRVLTSVSMSMAGGIGIPEALPNALSNGTGWAYSRLADALARARSARQSPWQGIAALGERTSISELRDLGGSLSLAATEGSKIRESLDGRVRTMRQRRLDEITAHEAKADQTISIAQVLLLVGLLVFMGYPGLVNILAI